MAAVTAMPAGTTADTPEGSSRMGTSTLVLPDLPVKSPPVHEGQKIMTAADAALNAVQLLEVGAKRFAVARLGVARLHVGM